MTQGVEDPVAHEDERQHREKRDDIAESPALEVAPRLSARRRVKAMKLEFLRSILRQLRSRRIGVERRQVVVSLAHLYASGQLLLSE